MGDPSRVYDRKNDGDVSFILGITPIIGTGKEIGQLIKGEDLVTGQKYGPDDYAWGTLAVVSGGTTRVIGKVVGKVGDLEKKGKALEAAAKNTKFTKYPTGFDEVAQYIKQNKKLPDNFITKQQAEALGWDRKKGNLHEVAPGKVLVEMFTIIMKGYYQVLQIGLGMKRILIIHQGIEVMIEFFILMMD